MSRVLFVPRKFLNSRAIPGAALRVLALGVAMLAVQQPAGAVGVGRPQTLSALGQPLHLLFPVSLGAGESLTPDCVSAEVLAGDVRVPAHGVVIQLEGESELNVRAVRLRSVPQIDEPLVTVSLSLGCPARLVRQYTAFIDPPGANPSLTAQAQPAVVVRSYSPQMQAALSTADARPSTLLAPAASAPSELPRLTPAEPAASRAAGVEVKPKSKPARRVVVAPQAKPAVKAGASRPIARLQLEPAEAVHVAASAISPSASESASSPASAVAVTDAAAERLAKLEQGLLTMQAEQRNSQQQLQTLRAELERAQAQRYLNPITLVLGVLSLSLAGASFYLWRSRRQERQMHESAWWSEVKNEVSTREVERDTEPPVTRALSAAPEASDTDAKPEEHTIVLPGLDAELDPVPVSVSPMPAVPVALDPQDEPVTFQLVEPFAAAASAKSAAGNERVRVNVEDLIDLEQQVDFFLVLGQDDAAIELLSARLDGAAADVALPYLKQLHLLQRAGREADFQALSQRYRDRFDLLPPEWTADMMAGAGLEDHAEVLALLQRRWPDSAACMALLQSLLVGHAEDGSLPGPLPQESLDLPTQADLLMLYGVARDKSEHEVRGEDIDLFLPLEVPGKLASTELMATMRWQAPAGALTAPHALEVDISLDEPEPSTRPDSLDSRNS